MPANVVTGAKAVVKIDGVVAGYATGISVTEVTLNGRVDSLGYVDTREIAPIGRQVSATCNFIRIFPTTADNGPQNEEALTTDESLILNTTRDLGNNNAFRTDEVLLKKPFDLQIVDTSPSGSPSNTAGVEEVIYTVVGCRPSAQSIVVDRGSLMGVQVTLDALHLVRHETEAGRTAREAAERATDPDPAAEG